MKKITLQQFWDSEKELAIHVRNEEEANKLCKAFYKLGKKWSNGASYLNTDYNEYKEDTCYDNKGKYGEIEKSYLEDNIRVYEFDEVNLEIYKIITLKEFWNSKEELAIHVRNKEQANKLCEDFFNTRKLLVIHVSSEKEAKALCEAMDRMGKSWKGGKSCVEDTKYERFKEETCYTNTMQFCDKATFENLGYNIYELEDVDLKINLKKEAELSD